MGYMAKVMVLKSFLKISFNPHVRSANTLRCLKARQSTPACTPQANLRKSSEKVVSGNGTVGEVHSLTGRITFTQIAFVYVSGEFLIHQV